MRTIDVARETGVSADTIRLYERKGLVRRPRRTAAGYRQYPPETVARVRLVRRALAIGFTLKELGVVLTARDRGEVPCRAVRALAWEKLEGIEARIEGLVSLRDRMVHVLSDWDARMARTPRGQPAGLLAALAELVPDDLPSPLLPGRQGLSRKGPQGCPRS
jgi:DNA-binding transcriptional MerR regulator